MKHSFAKIFICSAACIMASASCDNAGSNRNDASDSADNLNGMADEPRTVLVGIREEDFVTDVLEQSSEDLSLIKAAANTGTDTEVVSASEKMIADHEQMARDFRAYARNKKIDLDNDIDDSSDVLLLESKGADWDEEWADETADRHKALVKRFERAEKRVKDPELLNLITKYLPVLRSHLATAENMEARLDKLD